MKNLINTNSAFSTFDHNLLKFRLPIPENTGKTALYPYKNFLLMQTNELLIKQFNDNGLFRNRKRYSVQEIYEGRPFLQVCVVVNKKIESQIILLEN